MKNVQVINKDKLKKNKLSSQVEELQMNFYISKVKLNKILSFLGMSYSQLA